MIDPSPVRILVVDDEVDLLFTLEESLQRLGHQYKIVTAVHGRDALEKANGCQFDLLLTDLYMLDPNGIRLTELIRQIMPDIKVIWMTAYDHYADMAGRMHVDRYLVKPIDLKELRQIVRQVLGVNTNDASSPLPFSLSPRGLQQPIRVLVMEDDPELSRLFSKTLRMAGCKIDTALTVDEGRKLLVEQTFDILLVDVHMNGQNSLDLLNEIMPRLQQPSLQVVVVSGDPHYREVCTNMGIGFYLEKPVAIGTLVTLVKRLSDASRVSSSA